ncbi:hypothetical protein B566_EDAN013161, partial [Ephemera danica]
SYCQKHSVTSKKERSSSTAASTAVGSGSEEDEGRRRKRKELTSEERSQAKAAKLQEIEAEFDKHLTLKDLPSQHLEVDHEAVVSIYNYWKLKRKVGGNRPLIAPRTDDVDMLGRAQVQADQEKMRMFVQLRQDLERVSLSDPTKKRRTRSKPCYTNEKDTVRNLCYMVSRREKLSRSFFRIREQTFHKQVNVITTLGSALTDDDHSAIVQANHGPSIYDRLYSVDVPDPFPDMDDLVSRITGEAKSKSSPLNGLLKRQPGSPLMDSNNPYKRPYFNGASRLRNSFSMSSGSDSDVRKPSKLLGVRSDSSADEASAKNDSTKASSLRRMERELRDRSSVSGESSSDELTLPKSVPTRLQTVKASIYSDSEEEDERKVLVRTKAAVKEFTPVQAKKVSPNGKAAQRGRKPKRKTPESKKVSDPTELIVPQRQAAKKATESMRHSTVKPKEPGAVVEAETTVLKSSPQEEPTKKKKVRTSGDIYDFEKDLTVNEAELLAYVPQRQAAKKAAEHIKGLGKPGETPATTVNAEEAKKATKFKSKSTLSSSESDNEDEKEKAKRIQRTVFGKVRDGRSGVPPVSERPFLVKGPDSNAETPTKPATTKRDEGQRSGGSKVPADKKVATGTPDGPKKGKQSPSKKLKTSEGRPESQFQQPPATNTSSSANNPPSTGVKGASTSTVSSRKKPGSVTPAKNRGAAPAGRDGAPRRTSTSSSSSSASSSGSSSTGSSGSESSSSSSGSSSSGSSSSSSDSDSDTDNEKRPARVKKSPSLTATTVPAQQKPITAGKPPPAVRRQASREGKSVAGEDKGEALARQRSPDPKVKKTPQKDPVKVPSPRRRPSKEKPPKVTPPKEEVVTPVKKTPVRKEATPKRDMTPKRDSTPIRRDSTPNKSDSTPNRRDSTPSKSDSTPRRDTTPRREPSKTPRRDSTPRRNSTKAKEEVEEVELKKAKPMPKCKKKDLGILSDVEKSPVPKKPVEPEEPLLLPSSPPPTVVTSPQPPPTVQRSIFSPPHQKDQDLYDFERDILAVDETMARNRPESVDLDLCNQPPTTDDARVAPPLSFNFGNEFLFKVDSKEDSARETLNLVEKLRLEYAKKSVPDGEAQEEPMVLPPVVQQEKQEEEPTKPPTPPAYTPMEVKVGPPERDKLDQTQGASADERWVPPSPVPRVAPPLPSPVPPPSIELPPASVPELPPSTPSEYMARKWAESEMLPSRRSSSSSGSSTASSSSHRDDIQHREDHRDEILPHEIPHEIPPPPAAVLPPTQLADITGYGLPSLPAEAANLFFNPPLYPPHGLDPNFPLYPPRLDHFSFPLPPHLDETACTGYNARGRGKGRGGKMGRAFIKGAQVPQKLQGTVYDFDDDDFDAPPTPGVENLRAMRERRRSTDVHKYEETAYNDSRSDEGSFTAGSPPPPPPPTQSVSRSSFPDIVQPLLPGPVDMRTYSGGTYTSPVAMVCPETLVTTGAIPEGTLENQSQLLGSFANAEPHPVPDFVEDLEKELHSALEASRQEAAVPSPKQTVSILPESRSQLKVKIKGPFLDANYPTATPVIPATVTNPMPMPMPQSSMSSGPSNLRRMRKKELLRQYWTQDMNMQDTPAPVIPPPSQVNIPLTIPKAVASMISIPTRDDYKAVVDANMEKKRRKGGLTSDELEGAQVSAALAAQKKRGRPKVLPTVTPIITEVAPKLKIRIRANPSESEDRRLLRVRPPKKRLSAAVHRPSVEELKRECMKFRKKIMADFDSQSTKRDKKKKQRDEMNCVVVDSNLPETSTTTEDPSAPKRKLIIRIGKILNDVVSDTPPPSSEEHEQATPTNNNDSVTPTPPPPSPPPSTSETVLKVRTSKMTPIRLKLSRCEEGYNVESANNKQEATNNDVKVSEEAVTTPAPPPVPAGCEVR